MHVLPSDDATLREIGDFDVERLAQQLDAAHVKYFVLTLGQNSGYFTAPNAAYDRITGYQPGERCSARDLPLDLHRALSARNIRLMLYLPCQAPNQDARAQKAFGLATGVADQPIDTAFAERWASVIREWSTRYGDKVSGWWFDGGYESVHFNEAVAAIYSEAVRAGNDKALVTFNPGVGLERHTRAEDYTAGELNEPFTVVPTSRFVDGSQWHALTYLGSTWAARDTRYTTERWREWYTQVVAHGGAVTFDVGPNWDPRQGPVGGIDRVQFEQLRAIGQP